MKFLVTLVMSCMILFGCMSDKIIDENTPAPKGFAKTSDGFLPKSLKNHGLK